MNLVGPLGTEPKEINGVQKRSATTILEMIYGAFSLSTEWAANMNIISAQKEETHSNMCTFYITRFLVEKRARHYARACFPYCSIVYLSILLSNGVTLLFTCHWHEPRAEGIRGRRRLKEKLLVFPGSLWEKTKKHSIDDNAKEGMTPRFSYRNDPKINGQMDTCRQQHRHLYGKTSIID